MFQFDKEDTDKRLQPLYQSEDELSLVEAKPTTPAEKVSYYIKFKFLFYYFNLFVAAFQICVSCKTANHFLFLIVIQYICIFFSFEKKIF